MKHLFSKAKKDVQGYTNTNNYIARCMTCDENCASNCWGLCTSSCARGCNSACSGWWFSIVVQ